LSNFLRWAIEKKSRINKLPGFLQPFAILVQNLAQVLGLRNEKVYHLGREEVYRALYLGVEYFCGALVEGDIAEFGTMSGNSFYNIKNPEKPG